MFERHFLIIPYLIRLVWVVLILVVITTALLLIGDDWLSNKPSDSEEIKEVKELSLDTFWQPPDSTSIPKTREGELISYGRELVAHTAIYLGPKGKVNRISNGMNCQNCHLKAGTKLFGNNYGAVAVTYPKFRARSGTVESIEKRVNDCLQRSLNGQALDTLSYEMRAFVAYIKWVGKDVRGGQTLTGFGLWEVPLLDRAANPGNGRLVYETHCQRCHGPSGNGIKSENQLEWKYPPLWGDGSYNIGAGLFRLSRLAGYVKANMPFGTSFKNPILTDEQAWDVAAYINSLARPSKDFSSDWPNIAAKPFDYPFGPFADEFTEQEHKYGPFLQFIPAAKKK